jgi:hypothetical protein
MVTHCPGVGKREEIFCIRRGLPWMRAEMVHPESQKDIMGWGLKCREVSKSDAEWPIMLSILSVKQEELGLREQGLEAQKEEKEESLRKAE